MKQSLQQTAHRFFVLGMAVKGIDGILELVGAIFLFMVRPENLTALAVFLTQHELSQDPGDLIANAIVTITQDLTVSAKLFGAFYLLIHGCVKILLVWNLLKERLWAFPVSLGILGLLTIFQLYRLSVHFSLGLGMLTLIDVVVIGLIGMEWKFRRKKCRNTEENENVSWSGW
ncbi:DUF2127 domain-containing protein [Candidatus Peregrinibacteria bacterium]|nr:DUF2127 domain-containing protein [Candidatus Peregrinibacteria bacterium]MBI3816349.1 DUF2127 domain-containing protein [Candidatus Peregrinibacteria bacterium]